MARGIRAFQRRVEHADIGLIYTPATAWNSAGENYSFPVDAELKTDRD